MQFTDAGIFGAIYCEGLYQRFEAGAEASMVQTSSCIVLNCDRSDFDRPIQYHDVTGCRPFIATKC